MGRPAALWVPAPEAESFHIDTQWAVCNLSGAPDQFSDSGKSNFENVLQGRAIVLH